MDRALYYGDNLHALREMPSQSVDLVYLDPPFNSNATYNVLFKAPTGHRANAQIQAFEDTWHWGDEAELAYSEVLRSSSAAASIIRALRAVLGENDMMAYLVMMAVRLIELHRILKSTGSIYLHCDPTASHYLKILLDGIFGAECFRNEISWKRGHSHNSAKKFGPSHDSILFFSKSAECTWNQIYQAYDEDYVDKHYRHVDSDGRRYKHENPTGAGIRNGETGKPWRGIDPTPKGRHWVKPPRVLDELDAQGKIHWPDKAGAWPYIKTYLDTMKGKPVQDIWTDIDVINMMSKERLGYATQKPLTLLERIISASSNRDDLILDPFCGCGTAVHAAERLGRRWAGIDITHLAIHVIEDRLRHYYPSLQVPVIGRPTTPDGARDLAARCKHQFELWAVWLARGFPRGGGKKGKDRGVDGDLYFRVGDGKDAHAVISVKGGAHLNPGMVRDLKGTREREGADIGIFLCLEEPTTEMRREAASSGLFETDHLSIPRIQIFTVEELISGLRPVSAPTYDLVSAAREARRSSGGKTKRPDPRQREMLYTFSDQLPVSALAEEAAEAPAPMRSIIQHIPPYLRCRPKWVA